MTPQIKAREVQHKGLARRALPPAGRSYIGNHLSATSAFTFLETPVSTARYHVVGIGNAIVDVIARAEEDFLIAHGMPKGSMQLIDEARAHAIYDAMGPAIEISGGSAANTIVGVASFGARAAFVGRVKDDELGHTFAHDI